LGPIHPITAGKLGGLALKGLDHDMLADLVMVPYFGLFAAMEQNGDLFTTG
jgi:hypothetical protein